MSNLVPLRPDLTVSHTTGNAWVDLVQPASELAATVALTDFVPSSMRNKIAAVTACILYGAEIGLGPMQSLAKIDIISGRPAPRAELARALVLGAGHSMWVAESTNTRVVVKGHRRGEEHHEMTVTWTMDDVKKAGISNQNYSRYPRAMLLARASAELARMMAPDALGGISQFAEELDDSDAPNMTVDAALQPRQTRQRIKATTTPTETAEDRPALQAATDDGDLPPLPDDGPVAGPTEKQIKKMMACFNDLGIKDKPKRLEFIAAATRDVESSKDLTIAEAASVIDKLEAVNRGDLAITFDNDGTMLLTPTASESPSLPDEEPF